LFFLLLFLHFSFFYKRKLVAKLQNRANYAQSPSSRGPFISVVSSRLSQLCQPAKTFALFFFLATPLWAFCGGGLPSAHCCKQNKTKKKHTKFGVRFYHAFRAVFIPGRRTTSLCLPDPSRPKCPAFFGCLRLFFAFQALWLKSGVGGSHSKPNPSVSAIKNRLTFSSVHHWL
jgi:hypothetical protein